MFTSRLWMVYGLTCVLTVALGVLVLHDPFSIVVVGAQAVSYLFVCFVVLVLLSFVPRPALTAPTFQLVVFACSLAVSGVTYAAGNAVYGPLVGLPSEFAFDPTYYLFCLPVLGLAATAVAVVHLAHLHHSRRRTRDAPAAPAGRHH